MKKSKRDTEKYLDVIAFVMEFFVIILEGVV
jgi:hypothetical protein